MKKFLAILVLMFCGVNYSNADTLNDNFSCVSGTKTTMDKSSEVENGVKIEIGGNNLNDEYIQELFNKNPEMVINIKHVKKIKGNIVGNIIEIEGLHGAFSGETVFFLFSNQEQHSSAYLNEVLYFNLDFPLDELEVDTLNSKTNRVLYIRYVELSDEESQRLEPSYLNLYKNNKIKLNNIIKNHSAFVDAMDKVLPNKISWTGLFAFACFEQ